MGKAFLSIRCFSNTTLLFSNSRKSCMALKDCNFSYSFFNIKNRADFRMLKDVADVYIRKIGFLPKTYFTISPYRNYLYWGNCMISLLHYPGTVQISFLSHIYLPDPHIGLRTVERHHSSFKIIKIVSNKP